MVKFLLVLNSLIVMFNSFFGINLVPRGYKLDAEVLASLVQQTNQTRIDEGKITGSQVIVKQCGETVLASTYGLDGANGSALDGDEIYRIASMTKPVTALALLIEHDRGNLSIYDDVSKYIPEFKNMNAVIKDSEGNIIGEERADKQIKLYQLVSHTSGIADVDLSIYNQPDYSYESVCKFIATRPLKFVPGNAQEYSTGAFDVAARVIELTSGMKFEDYVKVNIFDKLGMVDTTYTPTAEQWQRFVKMHNCVDGKAVDVFTDDSVFCGYPASYHAAGASLCSTAADYSKFAEMLLNNGKAEDGTVILSKETLKLMSTPVKDDPRKGTDRWGLGVTVRVTTDSDVPAGSFGWSGAFGSHFWVDPVNKVTAVYMKNTVYDGGAGNQSATEFSRMVMKSFTMKKI